MTETRGNPEQQAAITHTEGPLRIMAGAGTGKTSTLTQRVVHLITSGLARPSEILALTFTNKAVDELRTRVDEATSTMAVGGERVDVETYHAFGARIVDEFGARLGLPAEPVVLTRAESWIILWRALDDIGFEHLDFGTIEGLFGNSPLHEMLNTGSRLNDELQTLDDLRDWLETPTDPKRIPTLSDTLKALTYYEQQKRELGAIDFGDQIALACQLLAEPDVASTIGRRYRYVMVDEFQDTNFAQSVMVQRLVGHTHRNICVVGDPNQAIYAFRGAAPDNLERFAAEEFRDAATRTLSANYRSTQEILDLANHIWTEGEEPYRGNLRSGRNAHGPRPLLVEAEHVADELAFIATKILELVESAECDFRDIAVIARKRTVKQQVFNTLKSYGIPVEMVGGMSLYDAPEIREIISWFRATANHRHDPAFAYLLLSERCALDERDLYELSLRRGQGESLQDTARRLVLAGEANDALTDLIGTLSHLVQRSYAGLEPLLGAIIELRQGASDPLEADNLERFSEVVRNFASSRLGAPDLRDLNAWLDLLFLAGPEEEAATEFQPGLANRVSVITAHAAKGLEWPVVFIACANHHDFFNRGQKRDHLIPFELQHEEPGRPARNVFAPDPKGDKAYDKALEGWQKSLAKEEEFRTLYVALTRAEKRLFFSWARNTPSRTKPTTLHPALLEAPAGCDHATAPPARE
ncbi:MAG: ATP-dependent helicase, partial [Thermomicrobiales bacterium]